MVAQAVLLGGNVRVGLEDNLYLDKGVFASNGQLVEKAVRIISDLGSKILSPSETRENTLTVFACEGGMTTGGIILIPPP